MVYYGSRHGYMECNLCYIIEDTTRKCFKKCDKCCDAKESTITTPIKQIINEDDQIIYEGIVKDVYEALTLLTPREYKVINMRFGLFGWNTHDLQAVGKEFQVTRERIREIEVKALKKLAYKPTIINLLKYVRKEEKEV